MSWPRTGGIDLMLVALPVAGVGYDVPSFAAAAARFIEQTRKPLVDVRAAAGRRGGVQARRRPDVREPDGRRRRRWRSSPTTWTCCADRVAIDACRAAAAARVGIDRAARRSGEPGVRAVGRAAGGRTSRLPVAGRSHGRLRRVRTGRRDEGVRRRNPAQVGLRPRRPRHRTAKRASPPRSRTLQARLADLGIAGAVVTCGGDGDRASGNSCSAPRSIRCSVRS